MTASYLLTALYSSDSYNYANSVSGGNCRLFEVVEMPYWRQQSVDNRLIFAKCIDWFADLAGGWNGVQSEFLIIFYPHQSCWLVRVKSTNQRIRILPPAAYGPYAVVVVISCC